MTSSRCDIDWNGVRLTLLADRAVYRNDVRTLYIADLHLGKPEHFRAGGAPVPEEVTRRDLDRLTVLIEGLGAEQLLILGDLFHAPLCPAGETATQLMAWRRSCPNLDVALVRGNHDRWTRRLERDFAIKDLGHRADHKGLTLVHDPAHAPPDAPTLAGHIHPAIRLGGRFGPSPASLRAACFWFANRVAVLPAFGLFTGMKLVRIEPHHHAFITNGEAVVDVTGAVARRRTAV